MERIDIIVPVFNGKKHIRQCISSIKKQSYNKWNLICVDDGSVDGSSDLLDEIAKDDSRITIIHNNTNRGMIAARLTGIQSSSSNWIMFVDIDDTVEPELLQKLMRMQQEHNADIVCCGHSTLSKHGWIHRKKCISKGIREYSGTFAAPYMCGGSLIKVQMWAKLYSTNVIRTAFRQMNELPNVFWGEDSMINSLVFCAASKVVVSDEPLYNYRYGGSTVKNTARRMDDLATLYDWRKRFLNGVGAEDFHLVNNLLQVLNAAIYYAHYSDEPVVRKECCEKLARVISDINIIYPKYGRKAAFLSDRMSDVEFANVYKEKTSVKIKSFLLNLF